MGKMIDVSGQQFDFLTALYPTRKNKRLAWHCQCICGAEVDVDSNNLRNHKVKSCGCQRSNLISKKVMKDKTGQKIGYLTVLGPTEKRDSGGVVWECLCDCGNTCFVSTANLSNNHTRSCGCKTYNLVGEKLRLQLEGKRFGKLIVLKELEAKNYESRWLCQCDCGNQSEIIGWHLTSGLVQSCGCLKSSGEQKIINLLQSFNIPYVKEATFNTCLSPKGYKLRFDFFVDNKYLIEYDGEQHFLTKPNNRYSEEVLNQIKEHDLIKDKWCYENNIPLIRIKYTQLNNLTIDDLLLKGE